MQSKFKTLFTLALITSVAQADKAHHFFSGCGFTVGLGFTTGTSSGENGSGTALSGIQGWNKTYPVVPVAVITIGTPNAFLDFTSPTSTKNSSGFSFVGGLLAQHVSHSGYTMGCRWLVGRSRQSSTLQYNSGPLFMQHNNPRGSAILDSSLCVSANDSQAFRLKDKWFTAIIAELGYIFGCVQAYVGPGVALHRQTLSFANSAGNVAAGITKIVIPPIFAVGARYALGKRMSVGFEWQRHIGVKKTWNNVSKIAPKGMQSFGVPTTKMNNNLFLVSMNYVFGGK